ncbi:MAG: hypothetical protein J3K34DRAFT_517939 [Monoraphidium minutum]|nr:MAG: hypothetical protein J3K34DRAFT_517939 [Monoraphidium minutum]
MRTSDLSRCLVLRAAASAAAGLGGGAAAGNAALPLALLAGRARGHGSARAFATGSSGGSGATPAQRHAADSLLSDADGLRLARHELPGYEMSGEEAAALARAEEVIDRLSHAGCLALIAGGWVRDRFLGRPSSDIDIATSATNAQIKRLFPRVIDLPRNTVKVSHEGELFEVATFRGHSRTHGLASAAADAEARDFTVNALYYCPRTSSVLDFVGGVEDIRRHTLRLCSGFGGGQVGRIIEDPLRIMRAVRFAVRLDLKLAPDTAQLLAANAYRCSVDYGLPPRRIWLELRKLAALDGKLPGSWARCLALAYHLGLLPHLFPWTSGRGPHGAQQAIAAGKRLAARAAARAAAAAEGGPGPGGGGGGGGGGGLPLELRVAALVHPSSSRAVYETVLVYFPTPLEQSTVNTLALAAELARHEPAAAPGGAALDAPPPTAAGAPCASATDAERAAAAAGARWARVYGHEAGPLILEALAAWMPEDVAARFLELHERRRRALGPLVAAARREIDLEVGAAIAEEERQWEARRRRGDPVAAAAAAAAASAVAAIGAAAAGARRAAQVEGLRAELAAGEGLPVRAQGRLQAASGLPPAVQAGLDAIGRPGDAEEGAEGAGSGSGGEEDEGGGKGSEEEGKHWR